MDETAPLLAARDVHAGYGSNEVLHGVSMTIAPQTIVALLGHNGAGKTTFLRTVFGLHPMTAGTLQYAGQSLPSGAPQLRVLRGIALVPETRNVFLRMSVLENLRFALQAGGGNGAGKDSIAFAFDIFPALKEKLGQPAGSLSGGQRQMLAVSLALVKRPKLLLLDEPSLGIAPNLVQRMMESMRTIRDQIGSGVLLVEQAVQAALSVADYVYVMRMGRMVAAAPAEEVRRQPDLWRYF
jgi:branched-chain amino acid transport system ATP-binding protein